MTLGENLARLRAQRNWSQDDLAGALDVSRQSVSKWETNASVPELEKLLKLSELFGVTLDALVRGGDAPPAGERAPSAPTAPAPAAPERKGRHTTAGTVLLCTGAVVLFLCLLLFGDLLAGLIYSFPFFLCGVLCFTVRRRTGLWCAWAVFFCIDFYLRYATGLSWTTVFLTHLWTAQMNYARLAIAWTQFLGMVLLTVCTARSYRTLKLPATKKELTWLVLGWLAVLVALPLLMRYAITPLRGRYDYLAMPVAPYFLLSVLCSSARLTLTNVALVRSLAVWRRRRAEKERAAVSE